TPLPVIGVPIALSNLGGLDSLLAMAQMPRGVPVATVAINGARNAGLLAARIIGVGNDDVAKSVVAFQDRLADEVRAKDAAMQKRLQT
ncbi:MAG: AIR carboxylase family protein, partial [Acidimicrobiales bacterium]